jgi:hypothetical protein
MKSQTKYVKTADVAAYFDISEGTVLALCKQGKIPSDCYIKMDRGYRFDLESVERALRGQHKKWSSSSEREKLDDSQLEFNFDGDN